MKIKLQLLDDEDNVLISSTVNQDTVETVKKLLRQREKVMKFVRKQENQVS